MHKGVIGLAVLQPVAVELAREPLVAIHIDLDRKREPGLDLDVDEPELAVHKVVVELQALALGRVDPRLVLLPHQRERSARLDDRKHADKSLADAVSLGDLSSQILLSRRLAQVLVGPPRCRRHHASVLLDPFRLLEQEGFELPAVDLLAPQEVGHREAAHQRQVSAKKHPIEARQHAPDLGCVLGGERFHGRHESPAGDLGGSTPLTSSAPPAGASPPWLRPKVRVSHD